MLIVYANLRSIPVTSSAGTSTAKKKISPSYLNTPRDGLELSSAPSSVTVRLAAHWNIFCLLRNEAITLIKPFANHCGSTCRGSTHGATWVQWNCVWKVSDGALISTAVVNMFQRFAGDFCWNN